MAPATQWGPASPRPLPLLAALLVAALPPCLPKPDRPWVEEEPSPVVTLEEGRVQGVRYRLPLLDLEGDAFLGIPFAEPPVGDLRFRHPVPVSKWSNVRNASVLPNTCHQVPDLFFGVDFPGSSMWNANTPLDEDCLYVNVWVPRTPPSQRPPPPPRSHPNHAEPHDPDGYRGRDLRARPQRAVMLWIFGGGFYSGSTTLEVYDARIFSSLNDVIVVSVAYRLGALGFLCLNVQSAPCNVGLYDQLAGLDWVRRNVRYFGGDPGRVTLFGESAGAASTTMHLLSPLSRDLFQRAIMQSGAANMPWATLTVEEAQNRSVELAVDYLGCQGSDLERERLATCLRNVTAQRLVDSQWVSRGILQFPFLPVVDGVFLPEPPRAALRAGRFKRCPILLGSNLNEGSWFLIYELSDLIDLERRRMTRDDLVQSVRKLFFHYPQYPCQLNSPSFALSAIEHEYTDWLRDNETDANLAALDGMLADYYFLCPLNDFALGYARQAADTDWGVYTYYFTQRYSSNPWPDWMGVLHGDEVLFMFGEPLKFGANFTEAERELSRDIMRYWTNFAKSGNPNSAHPVSGRKTRSSSSSSSSGSSRSRIRQRRLSAAPVRPGERRSAAHWPRHTPEGRHYLELNAKFLHHGARGSELLSSEIGRGPRANHCAFWNEYLPNLISQTESIDEEERRWKLLFDEWTNLYIPNWSAQLSKFKRCLKDCLND